MISLIDPKDHRTVPWKNGGGTASEISAGFGGDGDFTWRVATAEILADGPFSDLPGVGRVFTVIRGAGVDLDFEGEGTRSLSRDEPTRFAGAPAPYAQLRGGPATAFTLLIRDGALAGDVEIRTGSGARTAIRASDTALIFAIEGEWRLFRETTAVLLAPVWTAVASEAVGLEIEASIGARAAIVSLWRA
jgi:uncharacterized protein